MRFGSAAFDELAFIAVCGFADVMWKLIIGI